MMQIAWQQVLSRVRSIFAKKPVAPDPVLSILNELAGNEKNYLKSLGAIEYDVSRTRKNQIADRKRHAGEMTDVIECLGNLERAISKTKTPPPPILPKNLAELIRVQNEILEEKAKDWGQINLRLDMQAVFFREVKQHTLEMINALHRMEEAIKATNETNKKILERQTQLTV